MFRSFTRVLPGLMARTQATRVVGPSELLARGPAGPVTSRRHLPYCAVSASTPDTELPSDLARGLSKVLAETLNKPEKLVSVSVRGDVNMCRGGTDAPNAVVEVWSVGVFDAEKNPAYAQAVYDYLLPKLNMDPNNICVFFHPIEKHTAGHLLYAEMLAK